MKIEHFKSETMKGMVYLKEEDFTRLVEIACTLEPILAADKKVDTIVRGITSAENLAYKDKYLRDVLSHLKEDVYELSDQLQVISEK